MNFCRMLPEVHPGSSGQVPATETRFGDPHSSKSLLTTEVRIYSSSQTKRGAADLPTGCEYAWIPPHKTCGEGLQSEADHEATPTHGHSRCPAQLSSRRLTGRAAPQRPPRSVPAAPRAAASPPPHEELAQHTTTHHPTRKSSRFPALYTLLKIARSRARQSGGGEFRIGPMAGAVTARLSHARRSRDACREPIGLL